MAPFKGFPDMYAPTHIAPEKTHQEWRSLFVTPTWPPLRPVAQEIGLASFEGSLKRVPPCLQGAFWLPQPHRDKPLRFGPSAYPLSSVPQGFGEDAMEEATKLLAATIRECEWSSATLLVRFICDLVNTRMIPAVQVSQTAPSLCLTDRTCKQLGPRA